MKQGKRIAAAKLTFKKALKAISFALPPTPKLDQKTTHNQQILMGNEMVSSP